MSNVEDLVTIANTLVAKEKGILAADESSPTMKRRFEAVNVEPTEENRRDYREMLFRTDGISKFISGIILFDETLRQNGKDGKPLVNVLQETGIVPGIKVDKGTKPLAGSNAELVTEGLDGLRERLEEYRDLGARFTKWRAVFSISEKTPSSYAIDVNAHTLALYAMLSQEAELVPIVEPEVLMDGEHSIEDCFSVTEHVLREVFSYLGRYGVVLEGCLLKPNMVLSGKSATSRANPEGVGQQTLTCLKRAVPAAIPGIVFLSGGQTDDESVANLNAINQLASDEGAPWQLSFSYGRGLQSLPLSVWANEPTNIQEAQKALYTRGHLTSQARSGQHTPS
jgi:fructose-bisphosphate aldolase class I